MAQGSRSFSTQSSRLNNSDHFNIRLWTEKPGILFRFLLNTFSSVCKEWLRTISFLCSRMRQRMHKSWSTHPMHAGTFLIGMSGWIEWGLNSQEVMFSQHLAS